MAINVAPNLAKPTHHAKLTKDSTELGLILCTQNGKADPRSARDPFPNTAIKTYTGDAKHSDREPPFRDIIQQDWSLGRGQEVFEDDKSRYQDGKEADTTLQGKVILGPQPTFSTGIRDWGGWMPGNVKWQGLYGAQRYMQRGWTTVGAFNILSAEILLRKKGSPNSGVTIELRSADLTTTHRTAVIAAANITTDLLSVWVEGTWATLGLSPATKYRIAVFGTSGSDDVDNCWEIGCEPYVTTSLDSSKSNNGSDWTDTSSQFGIYYRALDGTTHFTAHFIEYRDQLYFATANDIGAAAKLYMNGDRGTCDPNGTNKDRLIDATKTGWTSKPGEIAKIVGGNAFQELQNWRRVTGNYSGYLVCDPWWNITHDTYDEYVILASNNWQERSQSVLTKAAMDIEVANDIMFITQGAETPMYMHREVNDQGVFRWEDGTQTCWYEAGADVDFVTAILDYISGPVLWMARNSGWYSGDGLVLRENAPVTWKESPLGFIHIYDGKTAMNEQSIGDVTVGIENKMPYISVGEPFTTGVIASKFLSPAVDIRFGAITTIMIKSSIDVASGVLELLFDDTAECASPTVALPVPALRGGQWSGPFALDLDAGSISGANAIISVGFQLTQDIDAVRFDLWSGVRIYTLGCKDPIQIRDTKITGLERYGEPEACWVLAEDQIGEIRNNYYQPVPLREIASVKSDQNGKAHMVHDVYLYFSLREGLEKYYRQHLDDIGPNRDLGLPAGRQGAIVDLIGFPGMIYAALDGGDNGYSSVLCYNRGGWHELYRARIAGRRIRKLHIQSIPGYSHSRLWISEGADVLWIPIAVNPLNDGDYRFTHESAVITSRIHGGMQDVAKFFKSVKLATKNLSAANGITIEIDYRTDVATTWTRLSSTYNISPYQEENLSSTHNVAGRWIELRIVLQTEDNTITPEVFAWVLKAIEREEGKYANTYTFRVKDWDRDLQGNPIDETVSSFMSTMETMIDDPLPITLNSISDLDDSKYVVAQPASLKRLRVITEEDGRELHICQLTLLEI